VTAKARTWNSSRHEYVLGSLPVEKMATVREARGLAAVDLGCLDIDNLQMSEVEICFCFIKT
jgi:hypothetical protein